MAIAANPDAAIHAATHLKGITFVSPGEELTCLGDFPIEHLDYSLINVEKKVADEILETLRLWGIRTFADFAALPVTGVSERLGQEGIKLQQLAAGKTERHLRSNNRHLFLRIRSSSITPLPSSSLSHLFLGDCCINSAPL